MKNFVRYLSAFIAVGFPCLYGWLWITGAASLEKPAVETWPDNSMYSAEQAAPQAGKAGRAPASTLSKLLKKIRIEANGADRRDPNQRQFAQGIHMLLDGTARIFNTDDLIVTVDNECVKTSNFKISSLFKGSKVKIAKLKRQAYRYRHPSTATIESLQAIADADPCVVSISRDGKVKAVGTPNDPSYAQEKQMASLNASSAFDTFFPTSGGGITTDDIIVAVVDTGISALHPDLSSNMWNDGSNHFGFNIVSNNNDPTDDNGHGTFVAGEIGARCGNNEGVCGVTGFRTKLMAVKILAADGTGTLGDVANGINWAVEHGAKVINLSLAGSGQSVAVQDAIQAAVNAGVFIAAAAGNENQQLTASNFQTPASYAKDFLGMMAVGSVDSDTKARSSFSNYSTTYVEISAPGSNGIYSTTMPNTYGSMQGTSMSTPLVAGAAALAFGLAKSNGHNPTAAQIEDLLYNSAVNYSSLNTSFKGGKTLDLQTLANSVAVQFPSGGPGPSPSAGCGTMTSAECDMYHEVNNRRTSAGIAPMKLNTNCINEAKFMAQDMASKKYIAHDSSTETAVQRFTRYSLDGAAAGENLGYGFATQADAMNAWMNSSSGHRESILDPLYKSFGAGSSTDSNGNVVWAQCFTAKSGDVP